MIAEVCKGRINAVQGLARGINDNTPCQDGRTYDAALNACVDENGIRDQFRTPLVFTNVRCDSPSFAIQGNVPVEAGFTYQVGGESHTAVIPYHYNTIQ